TVRLRRRSMLFWQGLNAVSGRSPCHSAVVAACDVSPVRSPQELKEFRGLPRVLRGGDPHWVEPLRTEQAWLLDRARHPFYVDGEGATAEFLLARDRRTRQPVGRVAAILNERYNRHRREAGAAAPLQ